MQLSPVRLLILNLSGSAGEMLMPFLIGFAFERGRYGALGGALISLCAPPVAPSNTRARRLFPCRVPLA